MSATILHFKGPTDPPRFPPHRILPHRITRDTYHAIIGLTARQEGLAHDASLDEARDMRDDLLDALCAFAEAQHVYEDAAEAYRQQLLRALAIKCPAAAKRIREGKPPRRARNRTGPVRSAVDEAGSLR